MQSLYENLPVYKRALDLKVHIEKVVKNFNRYHKYASGQELRSLSMKILILISKANSKQSRIEHIDKAIEILEELKITVRVCAEISAFKSSKSFEFMSKSVIDLLKQCEGWKKASISKQ